MVFSMNDKTHTSIFMKLNKKEFVDAVFSLARQEGYGVEHTRDRLRQIDFGHKKLHEGHLERLYPEILNPEAHLPTLINNVAPGRPCTHRPMKEIMKKMRNNYQPAPSQFDAMRGSVVISGDIIQPTGELWNAEN